jgi:hypothetical protein
MSLTLRGASVGLALLLAACSEPAPPPTNAAADAAIAPTASSTTPPAAVAPPADVAETHAYDARVIHFGGYGPAAFLGNEESVRQSFGRPMAAKPEKLEPGACYYLRAETPQAKGYGIRFMFEGDKFVRYDVDDASIVAPGGLVVGMSADAVLAAFPGQVESQPHKYVEGGKVFIVAPESGGDARLMFEIDATGHITQWRMGVQPQVSYVEGCS